MLPDITQAIRLQILDDRAAELTKEIAALPGHIAAIEKKLDNHQKRLERDRAFQHEIDFCQHEIRSHEDRILESMSESELLDKNVKAAEAELNVEKKQVDLEKAKTRERTAADQKEMDALKLERTKIVALMTPKVAAEYERIRKGRAGVAIAEVIGGRCSKCNMQLRPQFLQELKRGDTIMVCESCKRMLYWNPPQSVEDLAPQGREATTKG
jgi:uncharacterized protein